MRTIENVKSLGQLVPSSRNKKYTDWKQTKTKLSLQLKLLLHNVKFLIVPEKIGHSADQSICYSKSTEQNTIDKCKSYP